MTQSKVALVASELPAPVDLSHHFSRVTKKRNESKVKQLYKYYRIPGIGNLSGGLPNASYFPYDTLEAKTALPQRFKPTPNDPVDPPTNATNTSHASARLVVPHDSVEDSPVRKIDLATALQYGTSQGYPPLYSFLRQFTHENLHPNVPYLDGPEIILSSGNTDGFSKTIEALSNVWDEERDWIREREGVLCEHFAYMNAVQTCEPRGLNVVPVSVDDEGMCATGKGGLADVLENWDFNRGKRPHLIYTITIGQNPTSGVLSVTRRKEIYALCVKYDIIIIEDDPYWYLQFPSANKLVARYRPNSQSMVNFPPAGHNYNAAGKSSGFEFLDSMVPSYLSVDYQGRVVRLDTFSKTVAPGCRLGWVTSQPAIIERLFRITESCTQQPSGFVQSVIAELLIGPHSTSDGGRGGGKDGSGWKVDGWVRWLEGLRGNYERRMNTMVKILEEGKYHAKSSSPTSPLSPPDSSGLSLSQASLAPKMTSLVVDDFESDILHVTKTPMYDFAIPLGGMFVWLKTSLPLHPLWGKLPPSKLAFALWRYLATEPYLALVSPGEMFSPTQDIMKEEGWNYFRLCFAAIEEDELEKCTKGLVAGFNSFWEITDLNDLPDDEVMLERISSPCKSCRNQETQR